MRRSAPIPLPLLACLLASAAVPAQATTLEEAIAAAMTHAPDLAEWQDPAWIARQNWPGWRARCTPWSACVRCTKRRVSTCVRCAWPMCT